MSISSLNPLGEYRPLDTPLHRLDARVKFLLLAIVLIVVFIPYGDPAHSPYPYAMSLVVGCLLFTVLAMVAARGRITLARIGMALRGMWLLLATIILINVFFWVPDPSWVNRDIAFRAWGRPVYVAAFFYSGYVMERILLTVMATLTLTATTKPLDIAYAVEWYGAPLALVKVPVRAIGLLMSLALRFVPVLGQEAERIRKAQAARGLDAANGNLRDKWRSALSLFIPLIVLSFLRAEELAQAMDARGYNPYGKRTRFRQSVFRIADGIWLIVGLVLLTGALLLAFGFVNGTHWDLFVWLRG